MPCLQVSVCCHLPADTLYGDGDGNKSHSDFFCLRKAYLYISEPEVSYCHIFSPCSENYTSVEV